MKTIFPISGSLINGPSGADSLCLSEYLGSGAFGLVFSAFDKISKKSYAVKFPQPAIGNDKELSAFFNEVMAAREISHPNVVTVYYVETESSEFPPYLVMELVKGGTLKSYIDRFRSSKQLVEIGLLKSWVNGLVDGIAAINERMLHRDLKPDNILMSGNIPKIGDFGLSKIVDALTRSRTFKGGQHVLYMAPEGWKAERNEIQLDMYSMGVIFFEVVYLQYPYELPLSSANFDWNEFRNMHLFAQPKSLEKLRPDLPPGICHVIYRLLEKSPRDRFSTWAEVKEALQNAWGSDTPIIAPSNKLIISLLNETAQLHQATRLKRIEEEKYAEELKEQRMLDDYQRVKLLTTINETIDEFNNNSSLGKIENITPPKEYVNTHKFKLPHAGSLQLDFFSINKPVNLKNGNVRFAACLHDSDGAGLNFLLLRKDEYDLYGRWVVCRVRNSPLSSKRYRDIEPFGFCDQKEIQEIEKADRALHVYTVTFNDKIQESFLEVVLFAMRRTK